MELIISEEQLSYILENNVGYHSGDLGKSTNDGLYSLTGNRNTGHFGSGTYFFANKSDADNYGRYNNRPTHEIDLDKYNLYQPQNYNDGILLHDFLKELNSFYVRYGNSKPKNIEQYKTYINNLQNRYSSFNNRTMNDSDFKYFIKRISTIVTNPNKLIRLVERYLNNGYWSRKEIIYDLLNDYLSNDNRNIIREINHFNEFPIVWSKNLHHLFNNKTEQEIEEAIYASRDFFQSHNFKRDLKTILKNGQKESSIYTDIDSSSTFFMKRLGYDGIDVRHIKGLDNSMYGSVIYNL